MPLWIDIGSLASALKQLFASILWFFQPENISFICIWKCHVGLLPMTFLLLSRQETGIVLYMAYFLQTHIYYFYYFIIFILKKESYLSIFQSSELKAEQCHTRMWIRPTDSFASSAWRLFASLNFFLSRGQMSHRVWLCDHQNVWKSTDFLYDIRD